MWPVPELIEIYKKLNLSPELLTKANTLPIVSGNVDCVKLNFDNKCKLESIDELVIEDREFYTPDAIFGKPYRNLALNGICQRSISCPNHNVFSVENSQIIGAESILLENGTLIFGGKIQTEEEFKTLGRFKQHLGFLPMMDEQCIVHKKSDDLIRIDSAIFLGTLESTNYGSFLFRILPKILMLSNKLNELNLLKDIQFIVADRTPWICEVLGYLFPRIPIVTPTEVTGIKFSRLFFCNDFSNEGFYSNEILKLISSFIDGFMDNEINVDTKKIYVSRRQQRRSRPNYRPLMNEREVEDFVKKRGFTIIYPEQLSFKKQVTLFKNAEVIIGTSGSGMLNTIFAPEGSMVLDIEVDSNTVRQHAKIYSSTNKKYSFLFGTPRNLNNSIFGEWDICIETFQSAFEFIEEQLINKN